MNKKLVKHAASFLLLLILVAPSLVLAQGQFFSGSNTLILPKNDTIAPVTVITNIINIFLGLLGLLAIIILLIGGFKWMTANGVEDKVKNAKSTIRYGIIGLCIILLSYIIVKVVINAVWKFGTTGGASIQ